MDQKKEETYRFYLYSSKKLKKKVVIVNFVLFYIFTQTINTTDQLQVSMCSLIYSVQA